MTRLRIMEKGLGKRAGKFFAAVASVALLGGAASSAQAIVTYSSSFEAPTYTSGASVGGVDGWVLGSGSGVSQTVSAAQHNGAGTQSLFFDNSSTNASFYSVYHPLGTFAGTILTMSVDLYISSANTASRLDEVEFSTGTLGGGVLGVSIDGGGNIFAGKTWSALYSGTALATAPAGTFANRWLTATLTLNTSTAAGTVTLSGFGGTTTSYTTSFTGITTPTNVNLGTDYEGASGTGTTYYDNVVISTSAVPEPSTAAACLLAFGVLGVVIRRRQRGGGIA